MWKQNDINGNKKYELVVIFGEKYKNKINNKLHGYLIILNKNTCKLFKKV